MIDTNGQYEGIFPVENVSAKTLHFRILTNHPQHYRIVPQNGTIGPGDSFQIQIIFTECKRDDGKEVFTVEYFTQNNESDQLQSRPVSTNKIIVQFCSKLDKSHLIDKNASRKQSPWSQSSMELEIRSRIQTGDYFLELEKDLFPDPCTIPKAIKNFFMKNSDECLLEVLKSSIKNAVASFIKNGESIFH